MKQSGATTGHGRVPSLKTLRSTAVTSLHGDSLDLDVIAKTTGHMDTT